MRTSLIGASGIGRSDCLLRGAVVAVAALVIATLTPVPATAASGGYVAGVERAAWGQQRLDVTPPSRDGWTLIMDVALLGGGGGGGGGHWSGGGGGASGSLLVHEGLVPDFWWKPGTWSCDLEAGNHGVGGRAASKWLPIEDFFGIDDYNGEHGGTSRLTCEGESYGGELTEVSWSAAGGTGGASGIGWTGGSGGSVLGPPSDPPPGATYEPGREGRDGQDAECDVEYYARGGAGGQRPTVPDWPDFDPRRGDGGAGGHGACVVAEGDSDEGHAGYGGEVVVRWRFEDRAVPTTSIDIVEGWHDEDVTFDVVVEDRSFNQTLTHLELVDADGAVVEDVLIGWTSEHVTGEGVVTELVTIPAARFEGLHQLRYWSEDAAGNVEAAREVPIQIDVTPPVLQATTTPPPNGAGWHNTDVTISYSCSDPPPHDGIVTSGFEHGWCHPQQILSTEGAEQFVRATIEDRAGNKTTLTVDGINIDTTAPTTVATGGDGWHNDDVVIDLSATDALSGAAAIEYRVDGGDWQQPLLDLSSTQATASVTIRAADNDGVHLLEYRATDTAGNVEPAKSIQVLIDTTAPTITPSRTMPNAAGWNNTDVSVWFTCDDPPPTAGVLPSDVAVCTPTQTLQTEGADQTVTGTATDHAGNTTTATVDGINIDKTAPQVTYTGNTGRYTIDQTVEITCSATDLLSGVRNTTCEDVREQAWILGEGDHSYTAQATDEADNHGLATASFQVVVEPHGLSLLTARLTDELANTATSRADARRASQAASWLRDATDASLWNGTTHLHYATSGRDGGQVFTLHMRALAVLGELHDDPGTGLDKDRIELIRGMIVRADRLLAWTAIQEAGATPGVDQDTLAAARDELTAGDALVAEGLAAKAVKRFASAWRLANRAATT